MGSAWSLVRLRFPAGEEEGEQVRRLVSSAAWGLRPGPKTAIGGPGRASGFKGRWITLRIDRMQIFPLPLSAGGSLGRPWGRMQRDSEK
jgi:hypothetical protein